MRSYTVREDAGKLDNFIFIVKEPSGVQTENLLPVTLQVLPTGSSNSPAEEGLYTRISIGILNLNRNSQITVQFKKNCVQI